MSVLYLAPYFRRWGDLSTLSPINAEVDIKAPEGCPGLCLVFDSMAALVEAYPDVAETNVRVFAVPDAELSKGTCQHCGGKNTIRGLRCCKIMT